MCPFEALTLGFSMTESGGGFRKGTSEVSVRYHLAEEGRDQLPHPT